MEKNLLDLLYLCGCALNGTVPDSRRLAAMDLNALYKEAAGQSIASTVYMALEAGKAFADRNPEVVKKWQDARFMTIRRIMLLDSERSAVCGYMEQQSIWYLPLKGSILKDLYPSFGMRYMTDVDILFDPAASDTMREFMTARGYRVKRFGGGAHDEYEKPPVCFFELHRYLFDLNNTDEMVSYYKEVKPRLIPDAPGSFAHHFTDEDFYIFMLAHAYKHHHGDGSGLRNLLDIYVYVKAKGDTLRRDYIAGELQKLKMADFEQAFRELSLKVFSNPEQVYALTFTPEEAGLLGFLSEAGTFGNMDITVRNAIEKQYGGQPVTRGVKLKYYLRRIFPDLKWFEINHPFLYRHRILIPFYTIYRLFWGILCKRSKIRKEMTALNELSEKK